MDGTIIFIKCKYLHFLVTIYFRSQILGRKLFFKQLHINKLFTTALNDTRIADVAKMNDLITFKGKI